MTQPTIAQLHNLTDRAGAGLTPDEQARLRAGVDRLEQAEAVVGRVRASLASFDGRGVLAIGHSNLDVPTASEVLTAVRAALDGEQPGPAATQATEAAGVHRYLSTGCWHGDHAYCQSMTGLNGAKRPASCKFCQAACQCGCHGEAAQPDPLTRAEEARLAQDGIDTPGCDCGHDGMGVSWHGDDCLWRRKQVDPTA